MDRAVIIDDDSQLVEQSQGGSRAAFDRLVLRYHRPLVGYVQGRGTCSRQDAEDIIQDVWVRVLADMQKPAEQGGYDPNKGSFYTYVINRHAKFQVMQQAERRSKARTEPLPSDDGGADGARRIEIQDQSGNPEEALIRLEETRSRSAMMLECFRLTFRYGGYPHQVLAFAYSKLIFGRSTQRDMVAPASGDGKHRREIEGDPQRLDETLGSVSLAEVLSRFRSDYARISGLSRQSQSLLDLYLQPTSVRLELTVSALAAENKLFRNHHAELLSRRVADTSLRDYYGTRGVNAIPDWCDKVQNRIREKLRLG